jgi:hypothetical protein
MANLEGESELRMFVFIILIWHKTAFVLHLIGVFTK